MSRFFSPFTYKNGQKKTIFEITYKDIKKLINENYSEGFYIDYKAEFNFNSTDNKLKNKFRSDLCDDICSFSNNEGGWIIYGIKEDAVNSTLISTPIRKEKCHIDIQPISEVLQKCNPVPNFETKFISLPNNRNEGYFIIYVYEGLYPPYIANGKIKTRLGSSGKTAVIEKRVELDYLYNKQKDFKIEQEKFFQYENFYPPTKISFGTPYYELPIFHFGVKSNQAKELKLFAEIEATIGLIKENIPNVECQIQHDSIIILNSKDDFSYNKNDFRRRENYTVPIIAELFYDFSFKLYIPLLLDKRFGKEEVIRKMPFTDDYDYENYNFVDELFLRHYFLAFTRCYLKILKTKHISIKNYLMNYRFSNIDNSILIFDNATFYKYIKEKGIRISYHKSYEGTLPFSSYLKSEDKEADILWLYIELISMVFGYLPNEVLEFDKGSVE